MFKGCGGVIRGTNSLIPPWRQVKTVVRLALRGTRIATLPLIVNQSNYGLRETVMRSIPTMERHFLSQVISGAVTRYANRSDTAKRPLTRFCHQIARWRLRQRLAACGLSMPLWRRYSTPECDDITRALHSLCLLDGDHDATAKWFRLIAPCISGNRDDFAAVRTLISYGIVKPNARGPDGDALLHTLARSGLAFVPNSARTARQPIDVEDRVRALVARGADPDQLTEFGELPLQLAWERASVIGERIAGVLLEVGCNPMKRDSNGETLLHRATRTNNVAVVLGWRKLGLDLNPTGGLHEGQALLQTPLMFGVMAGCRASVDLLLEKKQGEFGSSPASLDLVDRYGATALHWAIDYDRLELADLLRTSGADACIRAGRDRQFCWTPAQLMSARRILQPSCPILRLLLKYRVDPEQPRRALDQSGWNSIQRRGFCNRFSCR